MKTVIIWNDPHLFSFQKLPYFIFFFKTAYPKDTYLPLIRERKGRLDYDQLTPIINHAKQDFTKRTLHVIIISETDILHQAKQNVLFNVCSILFDQLKDFRHVQLLFIGFFDLNKSNRHPKVGEFEKLFMSLVRTSPNVSYRALKKNLPEINKTPGTAKLRFAIPQKCYQQTISAIAELK